jgi:UvrD-like helicase C-terminal domain
MFLLRGPSIVARARQRPCVPNVVETTIQMNPTPQSSIEEVLAGLVERVTFHNAESGFCVLRAKTRGHRDLVTVIGHAATIAAGEWITASDEWTNDHTHGQPAYAATIHKSQGSEYPAVVIPVMTQRYPMLQRNLLYTGITRVRSWSCWWVRRRPSPSRFAMFRAGGAGRSCVSGYIPPPSQSSSA